MSATLSSADAGYMQEAASDHSNSDLLLLPASNNNDGSRGNSPISQLGVVVGSSRKTGGSSGSLPKSAPTTPNTLTPYSIPSNGATPETAARWNSANINNGSRPHQSTTPENSLLTATSAFPSAPRNNSTTTSTTPSSIAAPATSAASTSITTATGNDPAMHRPTFSSSSTRHPQRLATPKIVPAPTISPHITPSKKNFSFNVNAMPFVPLVIVGGGGEEEILLQQDGGGGAALPGAACHNTSNSSLSHMASSTHSSPSTKHFRNPGTPTSLHPQHQPMMGQSGTRVDSFYPQQKEGEGERYVTEEFYGDDCCEDSYDTDYDYNNPYRRQECGSETGSMSTMGRGRRGGSQPRSTVLRDADLDAMDENLRSDEMWDDYSDSSSEDSSYDDGLDEGEREWLESMLQPTENPPGIFK